MKNNLNKKVDDISNQFSLGENVELDKYGVAEYLNSFDGEKLDGDSRRNLTLRKDCHDVFITGIFKNENYVQVAFVGKEKDTEDENEPYSIQKQYIPMSCLKKPKPGKEIKLPEGINLKYIEGEDSVDKYLEKKEEIYKKMSFWRDYTNDFARKFYEKLNGDLYAIVSSSLFKEDEIFTLEFSNSSLISSSTFFNVYNSIIDAQKEKEFEENKAYIFERLHSTNDFLKSLRSELILGKCIIEKGIVFGPDGLKISFHISGKDKEKLKKAYEFIQFK